MFELPPTPATDDVHAPELRTVPLALIDCDHAANYRVSIDPEQLTELADSIARNGLLQPLILRKTGDRYKLIAGHRRYEALRILGYHTVPAHLLGANTTSDHAARLAENLDRTPLSPVEEALALKLALMDQNLTPEELAIQTRRSVPWIRHRLTLANYTQDVLEALHAGRVTIGVADELALVNDEPTRRYLLGAAINNGCTAAQARLWRAAAQLAATDPTAAPTAQAPPATLGPAPRVTRQCFRCQEQHDATQMSYLTVCPDCVAALSQVNRGA